MSRRLAVAAVLAGGLLAGCGAEGASVGALPQGQFVRASADLQPRTHLFGDEVSAQVDVVVDRTKLDPDRMSLEGSFAPYEQVGETTISRTNAGDLTRLRFETTLRCLEYACIGVGGPIQPGFGGTDPDRGAGGLRSFRLPAGSLLYADPDQEEPRVLRSVRWPAIESQSRINAQDPVQTFGFPFRWSYFPLPALTTRMSPLLLAVLLLIAAGLLLALPVTLILRRLRRRPPEIEAVEPEASPLQRAVELVEWSYTRSPDERRAALEALATELDEVGDDRLAAGGRRAAWRPPLPSVDDARTIVTEVREAHGLAG